ncbi:MAG TPA: O-antigen ligase family protein [Caulobacteraceae bacterium]|nr:O-antigen ligase family protein [Caulobacteraceae bacterium]
MSIEPLERIGRGFVVTWRRSLEELRRAWAPARQTETAVFAGALLLGLVSAVFGGASQTNALSLMVVELASLPLLFVAIYLVAAGAAPAGSAFPLGLLAVIVLVPVLQIAPLPYGVWRQLPGRGLVVEALGAAGLGRPSLPFSLAPQQTWRSLLALAPPVAMFLGGLMLTDRHRRVLAALWLALAVASLGLGAAQMLGGPDSALYLYTVTNAGSPVGFFSNRNHQASFLLCLLPIAAMFAARFDWRFDSPRLFPALAAALYVFIAIVGVAATHSRAGVVLVAVALAGSSAIVLRGDAVRRRWRAAAALAAGAALAIAAVLFLGLGAITQRFETGGELRFEGWPVVMRAAQDYLPLGSGVGSFQAIYDGAEPLAQVNPLYFNHAHNDYLELWLETGLAGAAIFLAFAGWFARRSVLIWRRRIAAGGSSLAAACTVLAALLLAHSAVDYPLRTEAIAVLFAFACGAIAAWRPDAEAPRRGRRRSVRP